MTAGRRTPPSRKRNPTWSSSTTLPEIDGLDVLKKIKRKDPNATVVSITGEGSEDVAVQAMKAGASDYITKPLSPPDLVHVANKLIREHEILLENIRLKNRGDASRTTW